MRISKYKPNILRSTSSLSGSMGSGSLSKGQKESSWQPKKKMAVDDAESEVPPEDEPEPGENLEEKEKPKLSFAEITQEREEREKRERQQLRQLAVEARLHTFGKALDEVFLSMSGVVNWMDRTLKVKVIRGKDLPICDARKSDPYIIIKLDDKVKKTSVQRGQLNPVWQETFVFKLKAGNEKNTLKLDCYDEDLLPAGFDDEQGDDYIGGFQVDIDGEAQPDQPIRRWWKLQGAVLKDIKGKPQVQNGEIQIEISVSAGQPSKERHAHSFKQRNTRLMSMSSHNLLANGEDMHQLNDDSKRMILISHVGRLRHHTPDVRRMAVQALAKTAGKRGSNLPSQGGWPKLIVEHLSERINKDSNAEVRLDALEALVMTSQQGDAQSVKAIAVALRDTSRDVRHAAVLGMKQIAYAGDETAILSVAERLEDPDFKVREAAGEVFPQLSSVHDERLINQVLPRLNNLHSVVRKNAVRTLACVGMPGAPQVLDGLKACLNDTDAQVRIQAMQVLVPQVTPGDAAAVSMVLEQLDCTVSIIFLFPCVCMYVCVCICDQQLCLWFWSSWIVL